MKLIVKSIIAIFFVSALFMVLGNLLDINDTKITKVIFLGTIAIIASGLMEGRKAKNRKRYQEHTAKTGLRPIGFIRVPFRLQTQATMLMLGLLVILGITIVAGFLCYQDGALKGEALFYMKICIGLTIATIIFVGVWINKMKQEIAYHEDGVLLYKKQGELLPWQEFGDFEKRGKRVSFFNRDGDKLFTTYESNEGYAAFWMLYQTHVEKLMPQQH